MNLKMGKKKSTILRIVNDTLSDIVSTEVTETDNYDWGSLLRPDNNFKNIYIRSGGSVQQNEEVNARASNCPFTMKLSFQDGTSDIFRINMKYAIDEADPDFLHRIKSHDIYFVRILPNILQIEVKSTRQQIENSRRQQSN